MKRALLLLLTACNKLYGLAPTELLPDADKDRDRDRVEDADDNCPDVANPDQGDEDIDHVGDVCDNCPLVANVNQARLGDGDAVGDACDAHPEQDGDCLLVFDSFAAPDLFDASWTALTFDAASVPTIEPRAGYVSLVPPADGRAFALVARDASGALLTGSYDVQASVLVTIDTGEIAAVSHASGFRSGYGCGLQKYLPTAVALALDQSTDTASITDLEYLSAQPAGRTALFRLTSPPGTELGAACRVDYGFGGGYGEYRFFQPLPTTGSPGLRLKIDPAELQAIAIYRSQPGVDCPPPILR